MSVKSKLLLIIILASFLRFYRLGSNPPSLYWDEVSLGFNAYSILKTARDEHQEWLPYTRFIAFGDYKPPGYVYFSVPSVAIFGLNEFAVRFPSALAGVTMVVIVWFLARGLFRDTRIAALAALLLAISPWSLHLSRGAFEANLAACFNLLAVFFFFKGLKKGQFLLFSALFFVLSFYTFNSNRLLMPILFLGLGLFYARELLKIKKWFLISSFLGLVLIAPLIPYLKTREARLRFDEVNIFSNFEVIKTSNERISVDGNTRLAKIIHHRDIGHFLNFLSGFFSFFEPRFLFISGDVNPRLSSQVVGELYLIELPFLLIGVYYLLRKERHGKFLLFWGLAALLPASTAREVPHALRSLSILPVPQIIISFGLVNFFTTIKCQKKKQFFLTVYPAPILWCGVYGLLITVYFFYYQFFYFHIYPYRYSGEWQYGYKELVKEVSAREEDYDGVVITGYLGRPYIYFLFYKQYNPEKFWQTVKRERDWFGFHWVTAFDKYEFGMVKPENYEGKEKILFVLGGGQEKPAGLEEIKTIKTLDGKPQFVLVEKR